MKTSIRIMFLLWGLLLAASCTTTSEERTRESNIPWNAPASWEGTPALPGFGDQGF